MAARAHDVAALALRGRSACLNFADSAWRLRIPETTCPKEIQKAASEAAMAFQNETTTEGSKTAAEAEEAAGEGVREGERRAEEQNGGVVYMDDEALLGMPNFFENMAEGMLLPPPEVGWNHNDFDGVGDVSLWSFDE